MSLKTALLIATFGLSGLACHGPVQPSEVDTRIPQIAFTSDRNGNEDIHVMSAPHGTVSCLTNHAGGIGQRQLAYAGNKLFIRERADLARLPPRDDLLVIR